MKTIYSDQFIVGDEAIHGFIEHVDILFTQPLWLFLLSPVCPAALTRKGSWIAEVSSINLLRSISKSSTLKLLQSAGV